MLWILLAFISAFATSLTTIFAKIGIKDVNSNFATFCRTGVVIIFAIIMCFITNGFPSILNFTWENYVFLSLSGLATGCSWLCYYKAIKLGDVNKVAPIDKSSFVLTSILFVIFFFNDTTKNGNILTISMLVLSMILMLTGTILMITKKEINKENKQSKMWLIFAILSSVFASLVSLFVKLGVKNIDSNLGTLYRTIIVFLFSLAIVLVRKDYKGASKITVKSWLFLTLSGIATGVAWICEYYCLSLDGVNSIVVTSIEKLSILITMLFCLLVLKEKFTIKSIIGLILLVAGIILIIIFGL